MMQGIEAGVCLGDWRCVSDERLECVDSWHSVVSRMDEWNATVYQA
jgi:hypothetical protein